MRRVPLASVVLLVLLAVMVSGCTRKAELATRQPTTGNYAYLRVIHSSPNAPPLDVHLDDTTFEHDLAFEGVAGFKEVEAGEHTVTVYPYGTDVNPVLKTTLKLRKGSRTTLMMIGRLEEIKPLVLRSGEYNPSKGEAGVRFVNVLIDSPELDLRVITTKETLIRNIPFGKASRYHELGPGVYELGFNIANLETTVTRLQNVQIKEGFTYTIVAQGELMANTTTAKVYVDE